MWSKHFLRLFLFLSGIAYGTAYANDPQSLALRVKLDSALRDRFQKPDLETTLAKSIVDSIVADRFWLKFCWPLVVAEEGKSYPDGELTIQLRERSDGKNWEIACSFLKETGDAPFVQLASYSVLKEGHLIAIGGPSRKDLPVKLSTWFVEYYLQRDEILHGKLCAHMPVTQGLIAVPGVATGGEKIGVVYLPFEKYRRFRWSLFRIECEKTGASHILISCGTGGKLAIAGEGAVPVEYLAVRHRNIPANIADSDIGTVYIKEYRSEQMPDCRNDTPSSDTSELPIF